MKKTKDHSVYQIIHSLNATEKAYFKKYAFKRENKNNENYLKLFDVLDKQKEYDPNHKKIASALNATLNKNIHATLNNLFKLVTSTMLEYRKDKGNINKFFQLYSEYDLFKEKKLNDLALKKLDQLESFTELHHLHYLTGYIYQIRGGALRNSIVTNAKELEKYFEKIDKCKVEINLNIEIGKFGMRLESLFHKNGGVVNKNEDTLNEVNALIQKCDELEIMAKGNFHFLSVIANNRFIVEFVFSNLTDFEERVANYNRQFENAELASFSDNALGDINVTSKNYAVVALYLNKQLLFQKSCEKLKYAWSLLQSDKAKKDMEYRLLHLEITNYAINNHPPKDGKLEEALIILQNIEKNKARYPEMMLSVMMSLLRKGSYRQALDLSDDFFATPHNDRIRDAIISIRLVRTILFLKLDQYELFQSEIKSTYKKILATKSFPFQLHIVNIFKKLNKVVVIEENEKILGKIIEECNAILTTGTGTEQMKAMELRAIAKLAFNS